MPFLLLDYPDRAGKTVWLSNALMGGNLFMLCNPYSMHRTQIYLPDDDYRYLKEVSRERGVTLAELIRRAVGRYLREEAAIGLSEALQASAGAWGERSDSSQDLVRTLRNEWRAPRRLARIAQIGRGQN